jgi:hypothetical protein
MNSRIKQLAEQAGAETWSRAPMRAVTGLAFTDENLEKFAELIVANFIDQITIVKSNDEVVAVTLTDEENQIQKVIWEKQIGVQK